MIQEYFIDLWPKLTKANELAEKLDDYDNVWPGIRTKNSKNVNYSKEQKLFPYANYKNAICCHDKNEPQKPDYKSLNVRKMNSKEIVYPKQFSEIRKYTGEPKCFSCNELGHISRDCIDPCKKCGQRERGHVKKNCPKNNKLQRGNLNVYANKESVAPDKYFREEKINNWAISALIDTGNCSCLMKSTVPKR